MTMTTGDLSATTIDQGKKKPIKSGAKKGGGSKK
jgi:hypothetical protein